MASDETAVGRNPPWVRDELILALDVYFLHPEARGSHDHPAVADLSQLLNELPLHRRRGRQRSFRNSNSVKMKLGNFLRFDSGYEGSGLKHGGTLERVIWDEFASRRRELHEIAGAIREAHSRHILDEAEDDIPDDEEAPEGRILMKIHRRRERNRRLVSLKKRQVLSKTGRLACEVCGFDFEVQYGDVGRDFAECHHDKPVSELPAAGRTMLKDLRILCSNCHRMIHRRRPWLTVEQLKQQIPQNLPS